MAEIQVNDILDELREENQRLLSENEAVFDLLDKYRKFLLKNANICLCIEKSKYNLFVTSAENEFIRVIEEINTKRSAVKEDLVTNGNKKNSKTSAVKPLLVVEEDFSDGLYTDETSGESTDPSYERFNEKKKKSKTSSDKPILVVKEQVLSVGPNSDKKSGQKVNPKYKRFKCNHVGCGLQFRTNYYLKVHTKQKHTLEKIFTCNECDKSFYTNYELTKHITTHLSVEDVKCNECNKMFVTTVGLLSHKKLFHNSKQPVFRCDFCKYTNRYKRLVREHVQNFHLTEFVCHHENCDKRFDTNRDLRNHIKEKHLIYMCPNCDKRFNTKHKLKSHSLIHSTNPTVYECNENNCKYQTIRMSNLMTHKRRLHSTNVNMISCDFEDCSKMFKDMDSLKAHRRRFHTERKFPCDWPGCEQAFKLKDTYESHRRTHLAAREFVCIFDGCLKSFKTAKVLNQHKQSHIKKFVCSWPFCTERFSSNPLLTAHMRRHENIRPFKCYFDGCVKDFCIKPQLDQHIRATHKAKPIPTNSV